VGTPIRPARVLMLVTLCWFSPLAGRRRPARRKRRKVDNLKAAKRDEAFGLYTRPNLTTTNAKPRILVRGKQGLWDGNNVHRRWY